MNLGAESVGGYSDRARAALEAGCDVLLVCNNPAGADEVLESLAGYSNPTSQLRMVRMHGQAVGDEILESAAFAAASDDLRAFNHRLGLADSGDLFES